MQRRQLLSRLSQAAMALAWSRVFTSKAHAQGPKAVDPGNNWADSSEAFTLGVASGEPRADSVVLWTRLAPKPLQADGGMPARSVPVLWEVASDQRFTQIVRYGAVVAEPASAHSVHVDARGLAPGQLYYYRFKAGGQTSPVGRTRTAPDPAMRNDRLRMAVASCQHYESGFYAVHREIAAADVELVLFLGDYIYETEAPSFAKVRQHPHVFPRDEEQYTLADYRIHHASYKLDADLRACHAAHPWLMVWDDHDVVNDYANSFSPDLDDPRAFLKVRAAAYQAYFEHLPLSPSRAPVGSAMRMHDHFEWGQLVDIWTVDGRQFRDPRVCHGLHGPQSGNAFWRCNAVEHPERSMLGASQEYWLADGLATSERAWKLIAQPTQIAPGGIKTPMGALFYSDGWDAFPAARERLMAAIAQPRVPDVVCLGGDVHRHVAARLRLDPRDLNSAVVASEFVASSVSSGGISELLCGMLRDSNPDLLHLRGDERGYLLLDITPQQLLCEFRATPHPARADARLRTQARYVVDRGVPGPRKA
jgi:alkaline phosphatase D